MARRITETLYFVRDLDKAIPFYTESLGMRLITHQDWGFALLAADESHFVGLLQDDVWKAPRHHADALPVPRLSYKTDDIDGEVARLREKGVLVEEVSGEGDQVRAAIFRDEDMNPFFLWDDGSGTLES